MSGVYLIFSSLPKSSTTQSKFLWVPNSLSIIFSFSSSFFLLLLNSFYFSIWPAALSFPAALHWFVLDSDYGFEDEVRALKSRLSVVLLFNYDTEVIKAISTSFQVADHSYWPLQRQTFWKLVAHNVTLSVDAILTPVIVTERMFHARLYPFHTRPKTPRQPSPPVHPAETCQRKAICQLSTSVITRAHPSRVAGSTSFSTPAWIPDLHFTKMTTSGFPRGPIPGPFNVARCSVSHLCYWLHARPNYPHSRTLVTFYLDTFEGLEPEIQMPLLWNSCKVKRSDERHCLDCLTSLLKSIDLVLSQASAQRGFRFIRWRDDRLLSPSKYITLSRYKKITSAILRRD